MSIIDDTKIPVKQCDSHMLIKYLLYVDKREFRMTISFSASSVHPVENYKRACVNNKRIQVFLGVKHQEYETVPGPSHPGPGVNRRLLQFCASRKTRVRFALCGRTNSHARTTKCTSVACPRLIDVSNVKPRITENRKVIITVSRPSHKSFYLHVSQSWTTEPDMNYNHPLKKY